MDVNLLRVNKGIWVLEERRRRGKPDRMGRTLFFPFLARKNSGKEEGDGETILDVKKVGGFASSERINHPLYINPPINTNSKIGVPINPNFTISLKYKLTDEGRYLL